MNFKNYSVQLKTLFFSVFAVFKDKSGSMGYPVKRVRRKTTFVVKRIFSGKRTASQAFLSLIEEDAALHSETSGGIMEPVNPIMPAASDKEVAN